MTGLGEGAPSPERRGSLRNEPAPRAVVQEPWPLICQVDTHFHRGEPNPQLWGPFLSLYSFVFLKMAGNWLEGRSWAFHST